MAKTETLPASERMEDELPKIVPGEFRAYNRMADMMDYYHNNFRHTWNQLYTAVSPQSSPNTPSSTLPPSRLVALSLSFIQHLTVHHDIEEQHIFPILAQRMPQFRPGSSALEQHKQIHAGLDKLEAYMKDVKRGKIDLERAKVKEILDGFGEVLWKHLEEEVGMLGAENMRRFYKKEEIARLPM